MGKKHNNEEKCTRTGKQKCKKTPPKQYLHKQLWISTGEGP